MKQRIIQFHTEDICQDPEAVEAALNKAVSRDGKRYWISGVCQTGSNVIFPLEELTDGTERSYLLRQFLGYSAEDLIADVVSHWQGQISTRGTVTMPGSLFGLFEKTVRN